MNPSEGTSLLLCDLDTRDVMITADDVRRITAALPRSYEVLVRDRITFRVGQLVYAKFSRDETVLGVAFPKEERASMVAAEPAITALVDSATHQPPGVLPPLRALAAKEFATTTAREVVARLRRTAQSA